MSIRQPISPFPVASIDDSSDTDSYSQRITESKRFSSRDVRELFEGSTICEIDGDVHQFLVVKRKEHDAPVDMDFMIVAIPRNDDSHCPFDFEDLAVLSNADAALMIDLSSQIQAIFQSRGADVTMSVLNTSMYDMGATRIDDEIVKFRQPQSMGFPHIKVFGYRDRDLTDTHRELGPIERDYIYRPLNESFSSLIRAISKDVVTNEDPRIPPFVVLRHSSKFVEIYLQVNRLLNEINHMLTGPHSLIMSVGKGTGGMSVFQTKSDDGLLPYELRISDGEIIKNARRAIQRLDGEIDPPWSDELVTQHRSLVARYLGEIMEYVESRNETGNSVYLPWGASFSVLLTNRRGVLMAQFVDASLVGKGANPISGILPNEERRPITQAEVESLREASGALMTALRDRYRKRFRIGDISYEEYARQFSQ